MHFEFYLRANSVIVSHAVRTHNMYICYRDPKIPPTKIPPTKIPPSENSTQRKLG